MDKAKTGAGSKVQGQDRCLGQMKVEWVGPQLEGQVHG